MPVSRYDRLFGGKGNAQKTLDAMRSTYGKKRGEQVFYGTVAKREHRAKAARKRKWGV